MGWIDGALGNFLGLTSSGQQQFEAAQQFNAAEAEKQRLFEFEMWNKSNEYNSPAAQMQRAREAGLNPSMLFGQPISEASVPAGAEASSSSGSGGRFDPLGLGADLSELPARIDLMKAQADEIRSRIPLNQTKVIHLKKVMEDLDASVQQRFASIRQMFANAALSDAQRENISFEQMMKRGYFELDSARLASDLRLNESKIKQAEAEADALLARANVSRRELYEMVHTFAIRKAGLEKQNQLTDAKIAEAQSTADKLRKEGLRVDQIMAIDSPKAINSQSWADDMSGVNGKVNQAGSMITYQIMDALDRFGGLLK